MNIFILLSFYIILFFNCSSESQRASKKKIEEEKLNPINLKSSIGEKSPDIIFPSEKFKTLQDAVNSLQKGQLIKVLPGKYKININLPEGVILEGSGMDSTFLDGGGKTVISAWNGGEIRGFTIENQGNKEFWNTGILLGAKDSIVEENRIRNGNMGVGIICNSGTCNGNIIIKRNIISGNQRGSFLSSKSRIDLENNTFVGNTINAVVLNDIQNDQVVNINRNIFLNNKNTFWSSFKEPRVPLVNTRNNIFWLEGTKIEGDLKEELFQMEGSLETNPLFKNIDSEDFYPYYLSIANKRKIGALFLEDKISEIQAPDIIETSPGNLKISFTGKSPEKLLYIGVESGIYYRTYEVKNASSFELKDLSGGINYYITISELGENRREKSVSPEKILRVSPRNINYQETSDSIIYYGKWRQVQDKKADGGNLIQSNSEGDLISLFFSGDSIAIYRKMSPDSGQGQLSIDGKYLGNIQFKFPETRDQVPAIYDGLGAGIHRLTIRNVKSEKGDVKISLDSFLFPAPFQFDENHKKAMARVNYYRNMAGIPEMRESIPIHMAANAHVDFFLGNKLNPKLGGLGFHTEIQGLKGFIGTNATERPAYFGFTGITGEGGSFTGDPVKDIDLLQNSVYHRNAILSYRNNIGGVGFQSGVNGNAMAINTGEDPINPVRVQKRIIYTYPANKQKDVFPLFYGELPNPCPESKFPVGNPINIYIIQKDEFKYIDRNKSKWKLERAELSLNGKLVPVYVLDKNSDRNANFLAEDSAFLVPKFPLKPGQKYDAFMSGVDSLGIPFEQKWSFTTAQVADILPSESTETE